MFISTVGRIFFEEAWPVLPSTFWRMMCKENIDHPTPKAQLIITKPIFTKFSFICFYTLACRIFLVPFFAYVLPLFSYLTLLA